MTASYDANAHTIEGTSTFDGTGAVQLSGGAIPYSPYDYDTVASIIDLGDHWNGTSAAGMSISITFSPDGSFTMTDGSCWSTGTMKPRASGKNVFDVSVTFTGSCTMANETATGVAVAYPLTSTGQMQLIAAVVSPSRTQGMAFFANR